MKALLMNLVAWIYHPTTSVTQNPNYQGFRTAVHDYRNATMQAMFVAKESERISDKAYQVAEEAIAMIESAREQRERDGQVHNPDQ